VDIFGVLRVTWLPRARPHEPDGPAPEPPASEPLAEETPAADEAPAAEETPAADEAPPAEETPAAEEAPPAEETPAAEEAPAAEETLAADEAPAVEPPPDVIRDLIGLADDLLALTEKASGAGPSPRTLQLLQRRVDRLLNACGVRILGENGPVVASRHEVVGVRPAGADDTEGWIASTVRRGYLHGDRLIRAQQVVAYAARPPTGTDERNDDEG
jgi:hypothetical protein